MRRSPLAAAVLVLLVYEVGLVSMPPNVFWSPDEGGKLLHARTLRLDRGIQYALPYPGVRIDPEFRFYAYRPTESGKTFIYPLPAADGGVQLYWPPWFPLLLALPLAVGGVSAAHLIPLFAGWLTAVLSGLLAAQIDSRLEAPAIVVVGLATPVYFYSLGIWEHTLAAALGVTATLVYVSGGGGVRALLESLPFLLVALLLRIEMLAMISAMVVATGICVQRQRSAPDVAPADSSTVGRWRGMLAIGAIAVAVTLFIVSAPERHFDRADMFSRRVARMVTMPGAFLGILINTERGFGPELSAEMMAVSAVALIACLVAPFVRSRRWRDGLTLAACGGFFLASFGLVITPQPYRCIHGLLLIIPFVVMAPHALPRASGQPRSPSFVLGVVAALYLVFGAAAIFINSVSSAGVFEQGFQWGQRYLLPLYPILAVLSLAGFLSCVLRMPTGVVRSAVVILGVLLLATGFLLQRRGVREATQTRRVLASWHDAMHGGGPIVTDVWWLPASLAELYSREEMFLIDERGELPQWIERARAHSVNEFTFASLGPIPGDDPQFTSLRRGRRDRSLVGGLHLTRFYLEPRHAAPNE